MIREEGGLLGKGAVTRRRAARRDDGWMDGLKVSWVSRARELLLHHVILTWSHVMKLTTGECAVVPLQIDAQHPDSLTFTFGLKSELCTPRPCTPCTEVGTAGCPRCNHGRIGAL